MMRNQRQCCGTEVRVTPKTSFLMERKWELRWSLGVWDHAYLSLPLMSSSARASKAHRYIQAIKSETSGRYEEEVITIQKLVMGAIEGFDGREDRICRSSWDKNEGVRYGSSLSTWSKGWKLKGLAVTRKLERGSSATGVRKLVVDHNRITSGRSFFFWLA